MLTLKASDDLGDLGRPHAVANSCDMEFHVLESGLHLADVFLRTHENNCLID
jgi:hypothetical protein